MHFVHMYKTRSKHYKTVLFSFIIGDRRRSSSLSLMYWLVMNLTHDFTEWFTVCKNITITIIMHKMCVGTYPAITIL